MRRDRSARTIFDQVAEIYDEVRPGYPKQAIEDIISISDIPDAGSILEVGCGTGQATLPFAKRGYSIHCLEMGENLARIASYKLKPYPGVKVENITFEDWPAQPNAFDIVLSATAFHWIPSEIGFPKAADYLKENGYLALLSNMHPMPYSGFFERVQDLYREFVPEWKDPREGLSTDEKIHLGEENIDTTGIFEKVMVKRYSWTVEFYAEQYVKLLCTFSDHMNLDENRRLALFNKIRDLINREYNGKIQRPYLTVLYLARKR